MLNCVLGINFASMKKNNFTRQNIPQRTSTTIVFLILIALGMILPFSRGNAQTWLYFQDSPNPDYYDFSWMEQYAPSSVEIIQTGAPRFPVESVIPAQQGINSLKLHWTSKTGGNWYAIAAGMDWTAKDISTADTLTFFFMSETGLAKDYLPKVFFEDVSNTKSSFFSISPYTGDLQPGIWTQIKMPMNIFLTAGDPMDYTKIKTVGYTQDAADGAEHTIYVDDVRVYKGRGFSPPVSAPKGVVAKGYENHIFLSWTPNPESNVSGYEIYRSTNGGQTFTRVGMADTDICMFTDDVKSMSHNTPIYYYLRALNDVNQPSPPSDTVNASTRVLTDDELMDMLQEATFRYFWDYAHPASGMIRERLGSGDVVTTGGSGFGVMAILVGIERGFITRAQGSERMLKILNFLKNADRFHGVWSHWIDGNTGKVIPFGTEDNGGDLVETAFMIQGLLAARQYFDQQNTQEQQVRDLTTELWQAVEWDWYRKNNSSVLYWHWSPTYGWTINMQIRGFNEAMIIYILAIASPTHGVPASLWKTGWAGESYYRNGGTFYGYKLEVGWDYGGPLFFTHYSFLGFDPRYKRDDYTNYFKNNRNITLVDQAYCKDNPLNYPGYSASCWGLTASDDPDGYAVHEPITSRDNGTITPSAALSAMPYAPDESKAALKHFYLDRSNKIWGNFGFIDAFNLQANWYATSYLAIDQGPIIDMIENYRTGLLWRLFMANQEIKPALDAIGFVADSASSIQDHDQTGHISCFPNPVKDVLNIVNTKNVSKIIITSILGQQVRVFENLSRNELQLRVNDLVSGLYHVSLYNGTQFTSLKFLKE